MKVTLTRDVHCLLTRGNTYAATRDATGMVEIRITTTMLIPAEWVREEPDGQSGVDPSATLGPFDGRRGRGQAQRSPSRSGRAGQGDLPAQSDRGSGHAEPAGDEP